MLLVSGFKKCIFALQNAPGFNPENHFYCLQRGEAPHPPWSVSMYGNEI